MIERANNKARWANSKNGLTYANLWADIPHYLRDILLAILRHVSGRKDI